jgi:ABC-2 type transport system ATP-binding protein
VKNPFGAHFVVDRTSQAPLVAENFGRKYRRGGRWAVRGLSATFPAGSITALVGPNGAGKSTFIRACLGFERSDAGRILVFGLDPVRDPTRAVAAIAYVPQSAALYRSLTIADHFEMAIAGRSAFDLALARELVKRVGLTLARPVGELSGGEQAQVALALAIGTRAPLLLLDEPLASLDPLARRDFLSALVVDVRARGATAVLSSHIVSDVEHACDRILVLSGGHVVLHTSLEAAKDAYRTAPARGLNLAPPVGIFAGPDGTELALVRSPAAGRPATLEEVVLGYLASTRTGRFEA